MSKFTFSHVNYVNNLLHQSLLDDVYKYLYYNTYQTIQHKTRTNKLTRAKEQ